MLPSQDGGILEITRSEGERVGAGQRVAVVYADESAQSTAEELSALRQQRQQLTYMLEGSAASSAGTKLDSSIHAGIISMQRDLHAGQYAGLEDDIFSLKGLVVPAQLRRLRRQRGRAAGPARRCGQPHQQPGSPAAAQRPGP